MVEEIIKTIIMQQFDIEDEKKLNLKTTIDDLNADSLDILDLISEIEDRFNIEVEDKELYEIKTIGDIVDCVNSMVKVSSPETKFKTSKYQYESNKLHDNKLINTKNETNKLDNKLTNTKNETNKLDNKFST